jgi:hypothetical protein|tara:strand:+ start:41 stop:466 length:426 start_codon:yes stop_codon:yes gene_type:complete
MSTQQQIPFKRQPAIKIKFAIALDDHGLRITVKSQVLTDLATKLMVRYMQERDNGQTISREFQDVRNALYFQDELFEGDHKVNKLITTMGIPNLKFLVCDYPIAEMNIDDVFTKEEMKYYVSLFQLFVKKMKRLNKGFGLL